MLKKTPPRLYALLARSAPVGVVFRRGPSNHVLLIRWNLRDDTFETGQWFKGRIYERRCDLSPDGELLVYFAANQKPPHMSWTAVSRPPYLTALALWPKRNCWGGGGQFASSQRLELNHTEYENALAPEFKLPKRLKVSPFGPCPGGVEDEPIWSLRLLRDGWTCAEYSQVKNTKKVGLTGWTYAKPMTWEKTHPLWPKHYRLRMRVLGIGARNEPWYVVEHDLLRAKDEMETLGRSDWADWAPNGDLIFAQAGRLYRLRAKRGKLGSVEATQEIADFTEMHFEKVAPVAEALEWPRSVVRKRE